MRLRRFCVKKQLKNHSNVHMNQFPGVNFINTKGRCLNCQISNFIIQLLVFKRQKLEFKLQNWCFKCQNNWHFKCQKRVFKFQKLAFEMPKMVFSIYEMNPWSFCIPSLFFVCQPYASNPGVWANVDQEICIYRQFSRSLSYKP